MKYTFGKRWSVNLLFLLFITLSVGIVELLHHEQKKVRQEYFQREAKEQLSTIRSKLEAAIVSDIYIVSSLATLISLHPNSNKQALDQASEKILRKGKHLRVIGLARDDVVNYVYPWVGNESVLGLDYKKEPAQWESIVKAKTIEEIFIAGPIELVQGGKALVARVPIFSDPPLNSQYWGVCSAVLNFDSLLMEVGFASFAYKYRVAIKGLDSEAEKGAMIYGDEATFNDAFVKERVSFPYGGWVLAVADDGRYAALMPWYQTQVVRLIGYPTALILCLVFLAIYRLYTMAHSRSLHDELTGLPNRRYFMYSLEHHFEHAKKQGRDDTFAVINLDLDRFKQINDTHGHAAGDKVLIACAERLKSTLRSTDLVARIGGDEFLVLSARMTHEKDMEILLNKLKAALCSMPIVYEGELIYLHISIGYCLFHHEMKDSEEMLKQADQRMYNEKKANKMRFAAIG
ncbi:diguanylate cyclase [Vibrio vulnificus]|uniref:diguanylate cyclase n=1 Tax=Vibrio vulnificus TaxID=672 RepID=UPI001029E7D8|nr:diguanylate cyclase [Vibrio vulnificus]EGQ7996143.1 sensor domain-containing diguanylate cyclase [Vibrio vulnificus]EGR0128530.1 sensor domain-containing diguanylate cyclase [Vibrio vulnificus]ELR8726235.1 sensor domain-containing diguanylate cyclase [Vibrio vulnificus]MCU8151628.1 sensor domain-containing diguanylate cyclase [Vibrio vulnificus]MCU8244007.1 sensor domain-containing diguanylate cyclase [Vibrio vulnificus]